MYQGERNISPFLVKKICPIQWENDKNNRKHHTQESQEVSPFPASDLKAAMNRQESMTNMNYK